MGTETKRRPNIVLIMSDDLGYEAIGANGGTSYATPVLDVWLQPVLVLKMLMSSHCALLHASN
ncbi:MAG: hypothetical protein Ct9H300mP19_04150 [Dehalococcoidia bacterium]|nr:MAG: hypothetical protein Ct9H300mP19_04150 [Dehalococcoidia bacterium]